MSASDALPYRPCAGVVLVNPPGRIFAGHRIDNPADAWQMPQGGIDPGETPRQAALRELAEETGLSGAGCTLIAEAPDWVRYDLPPELVGTVWKGRYGGQIQKWVLGRQDGDDAAINLATEHPEFDAWRWIGTDELLDCIVPFKRRVYEQVFAAFRGHLSGG